MHWNKTVNRSQLREGLKPAVMHNRQTDREGVWKCAGNAEATLMLLLLPQNPEQTRKSLHCSSDGWRALTSVHQPRAACLFHLFFCFSPVWFACTIVLLSWGTVRFCDFLFFIFFKWLSFRESEKLSKLKDLMGGKWWKSSENEENIFGSEVRIHLGCLNLYFKHFKAHYSDLFVLRLPVNKSNSDDGSGGKLNFHWSFFHIQPKWFSQLMPFLQH